LTSDQVIVETKGVNFIETQCRSIIKILFLNDDDNDIIGRHHSPGTQQEYNYVK